MANYKKKLPINLECGLNVFNELLSGKWKILILYFLDIGYKRPFELIEMIPNIDRRVLELNLNQLIKSGFVYRIVLTEKPLTVSYELTDQGLSLIPIISEMNKWGNDHSEKLQNCIVK